MKKLVLLLSLILLGADFACAQNITLEVVLPDELLLGATYSSLFKIWNLDHVKGQDSYVSVNVSYQINYTGGSLFYEGNFSKLVNSYTSSSTGYFFVSELGSFTLCGRVDGDDGVVCKNVSVKNPLDTPCSVSVNISLDKEIYGNKEPVSIRNSVSPGNHENFSFIIEYWVEDLFGEEVKKRYNTTNLNEKTFTPEISEKYAVFIAKNRLTFVSCGNTGRDLESSALFVVKNPEYTLPASSLASSDPGSDSSPNSNLGRIASFYTRTKKFHEEINLYANIKVSKPALLVLKGDFGEQMQRIVDDEKLVFSAKAKPGENNYVLELYINDDLVESKGLVVTLEGTVTELVPVKKNSTSPEVILNKSKVQSSQGGLVKGNATASGSSKDSENKSLAEKKDVETETNLFQVKPQENAPFVADIGSSTDATGAVVYQGSSAKVKKYLPYILGILAVLGMVFLFSRKMR